MRMVPSQIADLLNRISMPTPWTRPFAHCGHAAPFLRPLLHPHRDFLILIATPKNKLNPLFAFPIHVSSPFAHYLGIVPVTSVASHTKTQGAAPRLWMGLQRGLEPRESPRPLVHSPKAAALPLSVGRLFRRSQTLEPKAAMYRTFRASWFHCHGPLDARKYTQHVDLSKLRCCAAHIRHRQAVNLQFTSHVGGSHCICTQAILHTPYGAVARTRLDRLTQTDMC